MVLFSLGFRPFFLAASVWAVCAIALWLWLYAGGQPWPTLWADTVAWHGHEMLFGFGGAVIAGFLLTAVPNWTRGRPVQAWPLISLVGLWLAGRIAMAVAGAYPAVAVGVDGLFFPVLAASLLPSIWRSHNTRNLVFFLILLALTGLNLATHASVAGYEGMDVPTLLFAASHLVVLMITIFAGRIVPTFTANALRNESQMVVAMPAPSSFSLGAPVAVAAVGMCGLMTGFESTPVGYLSLLAGALVLVNLFRWHGHRTLVMPIVWILHAGYAWVGVGFLLQGYAVLAAPQHAFLALHALTLGAIGTMMLAMMTRVSLGHTGHKLKVARAITLAYFILQGAILIRVAGGWLLPEAYTLTVLLSGVGWCVAFGLFAVVYLPILLRPRASENT